ncbi:unnamed protein product [Clonostachys solani]|uniref:Zn(2)-C6 fungal-type domain-containing protein n=1 Tax=Clonostachys solani TaxID=160281 RepID=A0A9N9Z2H5_9HYPO|nr:unnamed protein product [Clonostachys solani]
MRQSPPLTRYRDVCRKHFLACPLKNGDEQLPQLRRGQKRRACDACFRGRLGCDGKSPCGRCSSRQHACTYLRLEQVSPSHTSLDDTHNETPENKLDETLPVTDASVTGSPPSAEDADLIPWFLLTVTSPGARSLVDLFFSNQDRREKNSVDINIRGTTTESPTPFQDPLLGMLRQKESLADDSWAPFFDTLPDVNNDSKKLTGCFNIIIDNLGNLHTALSSCTDGPQYYFQLDQAKQVFVPENVSFIHQFFRFSHPEVPIVHRPSFNPHEVHPVLLMAVFLCGSMHAAPSDVALSTPLLFDLAEEYAFNTLRGLVDKYVNYGIMETDSMVELARLSQVLQGALLMHGLQFIMNEPQRRERNRDRRLPVLVSTIRKLGFSNARHSRVPEGEPVDWDEFILKETQIRLGIWVFLSAAQQSILFNMPPSMSISEITGDFQCFEDVWEAKTAGHFQSLIDQGRGKRTASLWQCHQSLVDPTWTSPDNFPLRSLTTPDMIVLVLAFSTTVTSARLSGTLPLCASALEQALDRCHQLWGGIVGGKDPATLSENLYSRHFVEAKWFLRKVIKTSITGNDPSGYLGEVGHMSTTELHEFLKLSLR